MMVAEGGTKELASTAQVILTQIGLQVDLATTLATAIAGGLVALIIQIALHNRSEKRKLILHWRSLLAVAFAGEGLSLLFGYLARSAITAVAPILMLLPPDKWRDATGVAQRFTNVSFEGSSTLACMIELQFFLMLAGLVAVFIFAVRNFGALLD